MLRTLLYYCFRLLRWQILNRRKVHSMTRLLRQLVALFCLEKVVGEDNVLVIVEVRVLAVLGVDVEEDGQVDLLFGVQLLLLEAETLNLVEVLARLKGQYGVGGDA